MYIAPKPGRDALIRKIKDYWVLEKWHYKSECSILDEPRCLLTKLTIPLDKAESVFEYKFSRVSFDNRPLLSLKELIAERKSLGKGAAWTERQGFSLVAELRRGTQQNSMAIDLDCTPANITDVKKHWESRYDNYCKLLASSTN